MKKIFTMILVVMMSISAITYVGCGKNDEEKVDSSKTQFHVGLFKAGLGREWLDRAIVDFEDKYKDVSFEEGKKGVQVQVDYKVAEFKVGTFNVNVKSLNNSIYFLDQTDYASYVASDLLRDLTEVMNKKVYNEDGSMIDIGYDLNTKSLTIPENGKESLYSNMNVDYVDYLKYSDNKYYALPYYLSISGLIFDADYFDEKKLFFYHDGQMGATLEDVERGEDKDGLEIGYGPDGVKGTADDGMPETWSDFIKLLNRIDEMGDTPFIWSGAENYQRGYVYDYVWANYEGYDNYIKNFKMRSIDDVNNIVNQEGRKAAIKFFYDIYNGEYVSKGWEDTDETLSQTRFVRSVNETKRIAMLMEGGYWEVNMIEEFRKAGVTPGLGWGERNFKLFPMPNFVNVDGIKDQPKIDGEYGPEVLLGTQNYSLIMMPKTYKDKNSVQDSLAELFLYFTHDKHQMINFTAYTGGCIKPYDLKMKDGDEQVLTKFGQSIFRYINEGSKVITQLPLTPEVKQNNISLFGDQKNWKFRFTYGNISYSNPIDFFRKNPEKTVEECYKLVVSSATSKANSMFN